MAYVPNSGSVVAFQSDPTKLVGTVSVVGSIDPSSVLIINPVGQPIPIQPPASGSLPVLNVGSVITVSQASIGAVIIGGSITAISSPAANQSVSGTVNVGNFPATQNVSGSVVAFQGTPPWTIVPTSGSVQAVQSGTRITSLVSTVPSSVIVGASIFGALPAGAAMLGSIAAYQGAVWNVAGSVAAFNISTNASFISVSKDSSVIAVLSAPSIVGTYAEDAAHTSADKGLFILGVRNDANASFVSANLEYTPKASDSAGRTIIKPFSSEDGTIISYTGSVNGTSVTLVSASAIGMRNYITDFWLSNTGATTTLVYFKDGSTSIIGHGIAPAGGGESSPGLAIPLKTAPSQDLVFTPLSATSVLYVTVKGYRAP